MTQAKLEAAVANDLHIQGRQIGKKAERDDFRLREIMCLTEYMYFSASSHCSCLIGYNLVNS